MKRVRCQPTLKRWLQRSAGIVLLKDHQVLLVQKHNQHVWEFPKGKMEPGETLEETARREVWEETGLRDVRLVPGFIHRVRYRFHVGPKLIHKTVTYFLGYARGRVRISHEHHAAKWVSLAEARTKLRFRNYQRVLGEVEAFVAKSKKLPTRRRTHHPTKRRIPIDA